MSKDETIWQPIESVPKDGTVVLTYGRAGHMIAYYGRDNAICPLGWIGGHCRINHIDQPTHWMELPHAP